jgi:hypothetical protein
MQIVWDFSAADGFCRDAHIGIRREAQRQTRQDFARDAGGRSCTWLPKLEPTLVAWTAVLALSLRVAAREDTAAIGRQPFAQNVREATRPFKKKRMLQHRSFWGCIFVLPCTMNGDESSAQRRQRKARNRFRIRASG